MKEKEIPIIIKVVDATRSNTNMLIYTCGLKCAGFERKEDNNGCIKESTN